MEEIRCFATETGDSPQRLDVFLTARLTEKTRSGIQTLIHDGAVRVNGKIRTKTGYSLVAGDQVEIRLPAPVPTEVRPEAIPLDILYEDEQLVVINKPRGMVVHPAAGNQAGTLVNALLAHCRDLSGINGVIRPGIVHRLDKDTSGVMLAAKTDKAHISLAEQIRTHAAGRTYIALVHGSLAQGGRIAGAIGRHPSDRKRMAVVTQGGKPAVTHFAVLGRTERYSLVTCRLETGRTHQIRVHMAHIGHPLVGDPKYGGKILKNAPVRGQALHSWKIRFTHPATGAVLEFTAPLPADMQELLQQVNCNFPVE